MKYIIQYNNHAVLVDLDSKTFTESTMIGFEYDESTRDIVHNKDVVATYDLRSFNKAVEILKSAGYKAA